MLNGIVNYFDLRTAVESLVPKRGAVKRAASETAEKHAAVLPQYGAVALGVLADPLLRNYIETHNFALDFAGVAGRTGFALLMAIALLPAVYKNAFDPDKPLVQLCALFASGLAGNLCFKPVRPRPGHKAREFA
jgi:hypothetical protein